MGFQLFFEFTQPEVTTGWKDLLILRLFCTHIELNLVVVMQIYSRYEFIAVANSISESLGCLRDRSQVN